MGRYLLRQLDFCFQPEHPAVASGADAAVLQEFARNLLKAARFSASEQVRVEWNSRLRTCAGRADTRRRLVSLNPRLMEHGPAEVDRTLRHELAHLLAQSRAGRRRIPPHGSAWRQACADLGIPDEARCHTLPFEVRRLT